jgi:ribonuclease D
MATLEPQLIHDDLDAHTTEAIVLAGRVAWDIETSGLDWDSSRIGTCQLYTPNVGLLVVQLTRTTPKHLPRLLADDQVVKVFHHAPFDLRFMVGQWRVRPAKIKCTKVASKLLWPELANGQHSLAPLLKRVLEVRIDKEERLSNWLAPELSATQLAYAAGDVRYLLDLIDALEAIARDRELDDLLQRCYGHLPTRAELDVHGYGDVFAY